MKIALPWLNAEVQRTIGAMGEDYWPCGLGANRDVPKTMIAWSHEDGLIPEQVDVGQLFMADLHGT